MGPSPSTTGLRASSSTRDFPRTVPLPVVLDGLRRRLPSIRCATAVISVTGAVVGELAEARRRQAVMVARGEPLRWSAAHPLPNANADVQPAPGTRSELTPLERHYRIDINTIPPKIDERQWRL